MVPDGKGICKGRQRSLTKPERFHLWLKTSAFPSFVRSHSTTSWFAWSCSACQKGLSNILWNALFLHVHTAGTRNYFEEEHLEEEGTPQLLCQGPKTILTNPNPLIWRAEKMTIVMRNSMESVSFWLLISLTILHKNCNFHHRSSD